jgi:hypothetical protein
MSIDDAGVKVGAVNLHRPRPKIQILLATIFTLVRQYYDLAQLIFVFVSFYEFEA